MRAPHPGNVLQHSLDLRDGTAVNIVCAVNYAARTRYIIKLVDGPHRLPEVGLLNRLKGTSVITDPRGRWENTTSMSPLAVSQTARCSSSLPTLPKVVWAGTPGMRSPSDDRVEAFPQVPL